MTKQTIKVNKRPEQKLEMTRTPLKDTTVTIRP